jgi:hypothetical protein
MLLPYFIALDSEPTLVAAIKKQHVEAFSRD